MHVRRFLIAVVLVLVFIVLPFEASASPGRIASMNLDANTMWMIGLDETLFLFNPAILAELRPQVWLELVTPPALMGGVILNPAKGINFTLISGMPLDFGVFTSIPGGAFDVTQEQIRAGLSIALGGLELGVTAMYTGTSTSNTTAGNEQKDSNMVFDLGAGAIIILNPASLNVDVAGDVKIWSLHRENNGNVVTEDTTTIDFTLLGRLNWKFIANNEFHILGLFNMDDRSFTAPPAAKEKHVNTNFRAGFSDEISFSENVMAFAGGLFSMGIVSDDTEDTTTLDISGNAGVEVWIIKEMAVRAGLMHSFWHNVSTRVGLTSNTLEAGNATTIQLGTAVRLGDFQVDVELNRLLITEGLYFISGAANDMSATFTVTYYLGPSAGLLK